MKKVVAIVAFILITAGAFADSAGTGQQLHDEWEAFQRIPDQKSAGTGIDDATIMNAGVYVGFVTGVEQIEKLAGRLPNNTTGEQACAIVGKYLDDHPEKWNLWACKVVIAAFAYAYPDKYPK